MLRRLLDGLFGERPISYDEAKELARHEDPVVRVRLAARTDLRSEILYYLASDPSPEVRRAIANNEATPHQADFLLAKDDDVAVRSDLAVKIARLAPELSSDEKKRLQDVAHELLQTLARDQVTRVRQIVAETLKDVASAPPDVVNWLARDAEIVVSGPILENSPVLTDEDLLDIIRDGPVREALGAISSRAGLSEVVSDAVCDTDDEDAIAVLLANPSAQIREETLDLLSERAVDVRNWHSPLVNRPRLPKAAARRMARYVADNLLHVLSARDDMDDETIEAVRAEVGRRLEDAERKKSRKNDDIPEEAIKETGEGPLEKAQRLFKCGKLNEAVIGRAIRSNDTAFIHAALSVLGDVPQNVIEKIFVTRSAKGIVAVCWKGGLSIEMAVAIEKRVAYVSPVEVLQASGDGKYPLSREDMLWQIDFFRDLTGT